MKLTLKKLRSQDGRYFWWIEDEDGHRYGPYKTEELAKEAMKFIEEKG